LREKNTENVRNLVFMYR